MGQQDEQACCAHGHGGVGAAPGAGGAGVGAIREKFQEFLKAANAPGALDAATKQAIAIALSVLAKCEPCTKAHIAKARKMGFSQAEIDEAAWMAIAFGGSPTMMFANAVSGQ
jgi:AhpD family alkylhydroperoxidase